MTYIVREPLKTIQQQIKKNIFSKLIFPSYLTGSIKDKENPRDHIKNAFYHLNKVWIIKLDIKDYYPSIMTRHILYMWRHFFNFSNEASEILTKLVTYNGFLPQGSSTSAVIANLILWEKEPQLVQQFKQSGFCYTRYVDDITISSKKRIEKKEIQAIIGRIIYLLKSYDMKLNRKKTQFLTRNQRMSVTGRNVNSNKVTLPNNKRDNTRTAVLQFEKKASFAKSWDELDYQYKSIMGRINDMKRHHPAQALALEERVRLIRHSFLKD